MRDEGAADDIEILIYSNSSEFSITNIDLYFPGTKACYINFITKKF